MTKLIERGELIRVSGFLSIVARRDGEIYHPLCRSARNLIVNVGYGLCAEGLGAGWYDFKPGEIPAEPSVRGPANRLIQYCALGDDNTAPLPSDGLLGNEQHRQQVTDALRESNTVYFDTFFGTDEANTFTIREAGLFGFNATSSPDTGILLARTVAFAAISKTAQETLTFS